MLDFLSQPVGGYTTQQMGANVQGPAAQYANSNMSWGQLLGALASKSNNQSGQQLGGLLDQYKIKSANYPITGGSSGQKKETGIGEVLSAIVAFI